MVISPNMYKELTHNIKNFDVVHVHEYRTFFSLIVYYLAKKNKVPYIIQAHGALPTNIGKGLTKKIFDILIGKKILQNASSVIAITKKEAYQYELLGVSKNKIIILPNGVILSEFQNMSNKNLFRQKYSIPDNSIIILYVGRLDETKGLDLLIQSFADIQKEISDCVLVLIGKDYGFEYKLRTLIKKLNMADKVFLFGFLKREDKMSAFIDADVFVTPSFSGFPHTFLEACAYGLPIVTSNRYDHLDWIDNKVGFLVSYNKKEIVMAIKKIITNPKLRQSYSIAGKKIVSEIFNWDVICDELILKYYMLLEN